MLTRLHLTNFKGFVDEVVPIAPLTVLIGANASGKSNFFDALRFLQGLGLDLSVSDALQGKWEGGREIWTGIRGGASEVVRRPADSFGIESHWQIEQKAYTHNVQCSVRDVPSILSERLDVHGRGWIFDTHAGSLGAAQGPAEGGAINVAWRRGTGGRQPSLRLSASRSLLGQLKSTPKITEGVIDSCNRLQDTMAGVQFLDIRPSRMRDYVPRQADSIGAEGQNVSAMVLRLMQEGRGDLLLDWLQELVAPELTSLSFVETSLGDVLMQVVEADGRMISARSLSDGSLRFIGELVALYTAPPGSIVLMEEIENGLHPQRIHLLVELLESVTRERGVQVMATTHSPSVLVALRKDTLDNAVLFARPEGSPGAVVRRLADVPDLEEVVARSGIEHLFTTGWLERAL